MNHKIFSVGNLTLVLIISIFFYSTLTHAQIKIPQVSIIQAIEHPALDATRKGIIDTLRESDKNIQIDFQSAQGNAALAAQIAQKYVGSNASVLVGIGTFVSQALVAADQKRAIPIVFSSVTDPLSAKLVKNLQKPGNVVTGVSNFIDPSIQFEFFKKILPRLTKIGIIYSSGEPNSIALNEKMRKISEPMELELIFAPANSTADVPQATLSLTNRVQAIFINNDNIALSALDSIVKIATQNKIPVFCSDTDSVQQGALASIGPNQYEVGKQAGNMILQILAGENPGQMEILFPQKTELWINPLQAKVLKIEIPLDLLMKAKLVKNP